MTGSPRKLTKKSPLRQNFDTSSVIPQARTTGSTFDFTFKLPKPHNSGNTTKKNRRNTFGKNDRATP